MTEQQVAATEAAVARVDATVVVAAAAAATAAVAVSSTHGERLAIVETKVDLMGVDVTEIKGDVKTLLASSSASAGVGSFIGRAAPWVAMIVAIAAALRTS